MARKKLPPALRAVVEARRARFREMCKKIDAMTEEERKALSEKVLVTTVEGHTLSMHNQCLIAFQRDGVTLVGGFQQWKKNGRMVKHGEHGMMIWCATSARQEEKAQAESEDEEAKPGFIMGTVFDVSQTESLAEQEVHDA